MASCCDTQGLPEEDGLVEMRERNRVLLQENARLLEAVDRLKRAAAAAPPPVCVASGCRSGLTYHVTGLGMPWVFWDARVHVKCWLQPQDGHGRL